MESSPHPLFFTLPCVYSHAMLSGAVAGVQVYQQVKPTHKFQFSPWFSWPSLGASITGVHTMKNPCLSSGDSIEARCTKCRKNMTHSIIEVKEDKPTLVECRSCKRQHKFRPPLPQISPAVRLAALRKDGERKEWKSLCATMDPAKAKPYAMTLQCKIKTVIDHPTFGLGLVQRVVGQQKVEVLFEDGCKVMRCK